MGDINDGLLRCDVYGYSDVNVYEYSDVTSTDAVLIALGAGTARDELAKESRPIRRSGIPSGLYYASKDRVSSPQGSIHHRPNIRAAHRISSTHPAPPTDIFRSEIHRCGANSVYIPQPSL